MPLLGSTEDTGVRHAFDGLGAPEQRTRGTLLSVAKQIPTDQLMSRGINRLGAGVEWLPWPETDVNRAAVNCDTTYDKDAVRDLPDLAQQPPFLLWDRLQCSTGGINLDWLVDATRYGLDEAVSAQLASELEDADGSGGIGLVGNATYVPDLGSATAERLGTTIGRLERYLATESGKPGMRGVIHLTPELLGAAAAAEYAIWNGSVYHTHTGHLVVGDAGHTGQDAPQGRSAAGTDEAWIYATGDVWYALGTIPQLSVIDPEDPDAGPVYIAQNKNRPLLERLGLIVFDPNVLATTLVDLTEAP